MSAPVTLRGRLTRDPEIRFSAAGKPVTKFSVVTSRNFKNQAGEWEERDTTFWDVTAFGELAQNVADSIEKGTAVIVTGNAAQEEWETKDGQKRRSMRVIAEEVAPSLRFASAKIARASRSRARASSTRGPRPTRGRTTGRRSDGHPPPDLPPPARPASTTPATRIPFSRTWSFQMLTVPSGLSTSARVAVHGRAGGTRRLRNGPLTGRRWRHERDPEAGGSSFGDSPPSILPLPDASIDAVVCDPPDGLEFMGNR